MPLDTGSTDPGARPPYDGRENGLYKALQKRLPEDLRRSFSEQQRRALKQACRELGWGGHPVDIRVSIPLLFGRYYLSLFGGPEKRGSHRRLEERQRHPFHRLGNYLFIAVLAALAIYAVVLIQAAFFVSYYR